MTVTPALINLHDGAGGALHAAGSLTFGVIALIAVALLVVGATYRRAVGRRSPRGHVHPRRGTSALLLGAIAAVLLMLVSGSKHRISSLTIVSHASPPRTMKAAGQSLHPRRHGVGAHGSRGRS